MMIRVLLLIVALVLPGIAGANNFPKSGRCNSSLVNGETRKQKLDSHEYVLITSGGERDADLLPKYREFVEKMSKEGGVLDQLGIPRTKQVVEFVNGVDMRTLTSTGAAQPVSHYLDGSQVIGSFANQNGIVYEVVHPGVSYNHGYYRDDNPFEHQLSILMHVVGHNHFAARSVFPHYRYGQPTEAAIELDQALKAAYEVAPKDEVENYYMYMQTLVSMQDYYAAVYNEPADFFVDKDSAPAPHYGDIAKAAKRDDLRKKGLRAPTENILQAVAGRVLESADSPWKKRIIKAMTEIAPYRPALIHTQVMNEGWASIMQEIIMDYMGEEYNTVDHWIEAQHVTRSESQLNIQDPYWLGVRAWRRLREKFFERDEIKALPTEIAKDRAFILWADAEVISQMDDVQFLNLALDDYMLEGMGLAITRKATAEEAERFTTEPPPNMPQPEPIVVMTKDPARLRQFIIKQSVLTKSMFRPRVQLRSYNRNDSGAVHLTVEGELAQQAPLDKSTVGGALYNLANILNLPISLEALFHFVETQNPDPVNPWIDPPQSQMAKIFKGRLVVTAQGKMRLYEQSVEDGKLVEKDLEPSHPAFAEIEAYLHNYLEEMHLDDDSKLMEIAQALPRFEKQAIHSLNQMINGLPITNLIEHVPAAADAITEYQQKVASRMAIAFARAMKGGGGIKKTSKGMYIKALPSVVNINFDGQVLNSMAGQGKDGEIDIQMRSESPGTFDGDFPGGEIMGPIDIAPGDGGWRPGRGQGQGEGEPGREPGEEALDPSWIPFPEELYAKFLGEKIKLPNLKPKKGKVRSKKTKLRRKQNRRHGHMVMQDTVMNALKKGIGAQIAEGKEPTDDILDTLDAGFALMKPQDFVVRKPNPVKRPDTNAVVVFVRDASASTGPYTELYKRFVDDMDILIRQNYKNVKTEFIIFDTAAHVVKNKEEFLKAALGGGTSYNVGIDKTLELYEEKYPEKEYDRFAFVIGDLGDWYNEPTEAAYAKLIEESAYSGTVKAGWGVDEFEHAMVRLAQDEQYFGYVDLGNDPREYRIEDIRKLLKNEEE